ncbi:MAG TPA: hypothetical protein VLI45_06235 [Acidobacteriaceae bacterium]|nr:hypothetical protein [Acidobacteriaceae bacterium]
MSPVASTAPPGVKQVTNFGGSITCGYYATQQGASGNIYSQLGYAGLFDSSLNVPSQNLCRYGDQAADTVRSAVYPHTAPALGAGQLYTVMVGTNDAGCGISAGCMGNWSGSLNAALTWLALPAGDKITGSSLQNPGASWTPDLDFGISTSSAGATLSFPVPQTVAGRTLYIAYRVFDPGTVNGGTASVEIDGSSVATLKTISDTGHAISTKNGLADTIVVASIPLGAVGAHTLLLRTGSTGGFFSFQWAGVSSGSYAGVGGAPRVMVATLPASTDAGLNINISTYNTALTQMIGALTNEGMYITLVPCASVLNPATDYHDTVHPNDSGHKKLAAAFEAAL